MLQHSLQTFKACGSNVLLIYTVVYENNIFSMNDVAKQVHYSKTFYQLTKSE